MEEVKIIGGGLAGSEAAWQIANAGIKVRLYEMRPKKSTGAHKTSHLAEIICSNSLGSELIDRPSGLLAAELDILKSLLIDIAKSCKVPAGHALAVDRDFFSKSVTEKLAAHPNITIIREEVTNLPSGITIVASGPLTSEGLASAILQKTGKENLFFYDAIAPIIETSTINMDIAFDASRYGRGSDPKGDYINCPFTKSEYDRFIEELVNAETFELSELEQNIKSGVRAGKGKYFEGCLPVEVMAKRGKETLAYGPLRPVGLTNPHTNQRPYAVVQLRQDNQSGTLHNLVGFQTNLRYSEQKRVFRLIPGLDKVEFARFGQMHRNTFIHSPSILSKILSLLGDPYIYFSGQITGVEGYLANIASGLFVGNNVARILLGKETIFFPETTMIGSLMKHVSAYEGNNFQPMKANFGLLPPLQEKVTPKKARYMAYAQRAISDLESYINENNV